MDDSFAWRKSVATEPTTKVAGIVFNIPRYMLSFMASMHLMTMPHLFIAICFNHAKKNSYIAANSWSQMLALMVTH